MAGRNRRAGRRARGGLLFAGVFAVIALAWGYTTFMPAGITLASFMPMSSDERKIMDQLTAGEGSAAPTGDSESAAGGGEGSGSSGNSGGRTELCEGAQSQEEGQASEEIPQGLHQRRSETAALRYVSGVYGYSGGDAGEYVEGVKPVAECPEFESSSGAELVREAAGELEDGEQFSGAAFLENTRITEDNGQVIVAEITFRVGEGSGWGQGNQPELTGEVNEYRQELTIIPKEADYTVASAKRPELVEEGGPDG